MSPKRSVADILCLLRFLLLWLPNVVCETYYFCSVIKSPNEVWRFIVFAPFLLIIIIMAPKRSLWDILLLLSFFFLLLLLFLLFCRLPHFFLPHQFCPERFSEMPWSNFMKPVGISYAMWSCAFKGWFFQNGCRCHGNGQNAKKWKNTKMIIASYSPNRN